MSNRVSHVALSGAIAPTRPSPAYRLGLVAVALTMLLLPILYVGLIVLAGVGVWWHLTSNTWILGGSATIWRLILYAGPAIAGLVLVFFMVKPMLARPAKGQEPIPVLPTAEPELFAFIEQICGQVRAPVPRRVQVDCQVNASAGFMPGRLSLLKGDLVLTIGLPLAAGLSVRELGGVLAHEFGHFAQGGGMRLTAIVRGINAWFARVVYERDQWDEKLDELTKEVDWRLAAVIAMARGSVWVSRRLLAGLMFAGHAIGCFMLRQMEYDADSYEIKFAGSGAFARTSARMRELNVGAHVGYNDLREGWQQRKLPSNLPVFLVNRSSRLPESLFAQLRGVPEVTTGVFDTHPSDADRVRVAEAAAEPGILVGGDGPATELFQDFDGLSAAATRHHYAHDLALDLDTAILEETELAIRAAETREERQRAVKHFLGDGLSSYRPLRLDVSELDQLGAAELLVAWRAARDAMAASAHISEDYQRFEALVRKQDLAFSALELLNAGFSLADPTSFDLLEGTADAAVSAGASALEQQKELVPSLERFEEAATRRLLCCVRLLVHIEGARHSDATGDGVTEPAAAAEALAVIEALNTLTGVIPHVCDLRRFMLALTLLEHNRSASTLPDQLQTCIALLHTRVSRSLEQLRAGLGSVACPRAFASEPMTLASRCGLSQSAPAETLSDIVDRASTLYDGMLGSIAVIALRAESTLDMENA